MKKILLIITLFPFTLFAQQFSGFGDIKIGNEEKAFIENISKLFESKIQIVDDKKASQSRIEWIMIGNDPNKKSQLYLLQLKYGIIAWPMVLHEPDAAKLSEMQSDCKFYYIPKYQVGSSMIKNIFITCRNGKIVLIETDYDQNIIVAAKEKYKPTVSLDTAYSIECTYLISGAKESKKVVKQINMWEYSNLIAKTVIIGDYDEKCKDIMSLYIKFSDKEFLLYMDDLEKKNKEKKLQEEKEKIKSVKKEI